MFLGATLLSGCNRRTPAPAKSNTKTVAIATLMAHPALDQVIAGVKERLKSAGYEEGKNLKIIERNANGQAQLAATIASELSASDADVIVAVTTPMAQSIIKVAHVPVVFA